MLLILTMFSGVYYENNTDWNTFSFNFLWFSSNSRIRDEYAGMEEIKKEEKGKKKKLSQKGKKKKKGFFSKVFGSK